MLKRALRREFGASTSSGLWFLGGLAGADEGYTIELVPPVEDERDVALALDGIFLTERGKQHSSSALFNENKQRVLEAETADIRRAIAAASP